MKRIGLIADTHIPVAMAELPREVAKAFSGVDLILHAGDIYTVSVLDALEAIAPVLAAHGNGDHDFPNEPRVKRSHNINLEGVRIGLSHGLALPPDPWRPLSVIMEREFGGPVDVFVYGDTHVPEVEMESGVLMVNPGSPTLPHNLAAQLGTVAILEVSEGKASAHIIQL